MNGESTSVPNDCGALPEKEHIPLKPVLKRGSYVGFKSVEECESPDDYGPEDKNPDLFLSDGASRIDFVLIWTKSLKPKSADAIHFKRRVVFENSLRDEGLVVEEEEIEESNIHVVKIHTPWEVLTRYAEILKFRMPMKESIEDDLAKMVAMKDAVQGFHTEIWPHEQIMWGVKSWFEKFTHFFKPSEAIFPPKDKYFTAVYSRDKEYLFDMDFGIFTTSQRSRITEFILRRKKFSEDVEDDNAFGIDKLVSEGTYTAAYPLHEGDVKTPGNPRNRLYTEWASLSKCHKYQPLDYIKEYYGVKIGLYFAWLGFYTNMLIPASIVGLLCFLYGCLTLPYNQPSEDICNGLNITMCPICDHFCNYWELKETCLHARITYLFDNPATLFFAIFMSFWAATFLEMWKRYSAEINHRWDLTGFDTAEEHPRPEYIARLCRTSKRTINYITKTVEPYVPFWSMKLPMVCCSFSVVILLVCMALAAVLAVVFYRMSTLAALALHRNNIINSYAMIITTATGASINLCCILLFNQVYLRVARYLTNLELPRTQSEYDDSLTLKIYLLQFVNYYASIIYIAFFKGKFVGYPGDYNRLFGFRQEECGPGGCLLELCVQLGIIMVGKQAMNTGIEMVLPVFWKWLQNAYFKLTRYEEPGASKPQWAKDLQLLEFGNQGLFGEYLEMVLQFGFVTIFVAAFPLAPLFALVNNVIEIRLDAKKLLTDFRRPVAQRVKNIGVWFRILDSVGKFAVITNAFIIAFTSNFIPRLVYRYTMSEDQSLNGFLNSTLSYFDVNDFPPGYEPEQNLTITYCRYLDHREPPTSPPEIKYHHTRWFWHILAARLAFVVVFENVAVLVMAFVRWCIPDVPRELREKIRREAYLTSELIMEQELLRAKAGGQTPPTSGGPSKPPYGFRLDLGERKHIQDATEISQELIT